MIASLIQFMILKIHANNICLGAKVGLKREYGHKIQLRGELIIFSISFNSDFRFRYLNAPSIISLAIPFEAKAKTKGSK